MMSWSDLAIKFTMLLRKAKKQTAKNKPQIASHAFSINLDKVINLGSNTINSLTTPFKTPTHKPIPTLVIFY